MGGGERHTVSKTPYQERANQLHHAALEIVGIESVESVFETVVETAHSVLEFERCTLFVRDGSSFRPAVSSDHAAVIEPGATISTEVLDRAYHENRSILLDERRRHTDGVAFGDRFQSGLVVTVGDVGVMQALSTSHEYTRQDLELAELLVEYAVAAIDRARSERAVRSQKRKIAELHAVATTLESCTSHEALFELTIEAAEEILGFEWSSIVTVVDSHFVVAARSAASPVAVGDRLLRTDEGISGECYQTGQPVLVDDVEQNATSKPVEEQFRSGIAVPVGTVGVFNAVDSQTEAFDEADLELTELLCANVGEAYERIELQTRLRERQRELDLLKQVQSRVLRHNIRNDLGIIAGAANTIPDVDDRASMLQLAETIASTAGSLIATSEKTRQIEMVAERSGQRIVTDLCAIVDDVLSTLRAEYPNASLETECPGPRLVTVHPNLPLALENLVENAIVHNSDEPNVLVRVHTTDETTVCTVADDGPGIPSLETAVLDRNQETALEHGSGAGLWLIDWIVDRSGGELSFQTTETGTTVEVRVPTAESSRRS